MKFLGVNLVAHVVEVGGVISGRGDLAQNCRLCLRTEACGFAEDNPGRIPADALTQENRVAQVSPDHLVRVRSW